DGQHRNFKQYRMQPRALYRNGDFAGRITVVNVDAALGKMEKPEKVHEVAFYEAQAAQIVEFVLAKAQLAQLVHLVADFVQPWAQVGPGCTALVAVLDLGSREVMQHHLHHGELVQVGIQQRIDDHDLETRFTFRSIGNFLRQL